MIAQGSPLRALSVGTTIHILGKWNAVSEAGIYTIVGRKNNMVISSRENMYYAGVERVLASCPGVREGIAYGLPDARLGRGD